MAILIKIMVTRLEPSKPGRTPLPPRSRGPKAKPATRPKLEPDDLLFPVRVVVGDERRPPFSRLGILRVC